MKITRTKKTSPDRSTRMRVPRHVGLIPDGNRRWADARGLPRQEGYSAGIAPGIELVAQCRELGMEEVSIYGFTLENTHRPKVQVDAFRRACVDFADRALAANAALLVIGDCDSRAFPDELRDFVTHRTPGDLRVNMLVNYGWQWDLSVEFEPTPESSAKRHPRLGSFGASRIDLVVRWGGRRRLSGFLPLQSAYADLHVIDTLWPDMRSEEFEDALRWYAQQELTLGG